MTSSFLLARVLFQFTNEADDLIADLSAVTLSPDGSLWIASDELTSLDRLSRLDSCTFGDRRQFPLTQYLDRVNAEQEIDIEGLDYHGSYLWFTGSHSSKRKKPKGKSRKKDLDRLTRIETEENRYLLGRIPISRGELFKVHPGQTDAECYELTAACLSSEDTDRLLLDTLKTDDHLGLFVSAGIPSKENGLDIEGLAVSNNRLFLGLRGPVLRGWAVILELEVNDTQPGILTLNTFEKTDRPYRKHFVNLNGNGIRDLCFDGDDLLILSGPTMDCEGLMKVFRLKDALDAKKDMFSDRDSGDLEEIFDIPFHFGQDRAEGLALFSGFEGQKSLLVVYDSPNPERIVGGRSIVMDVFKL